MANVMDYLAWRGDVLLTEKGIGEVDNLIFCLLSYVDLDGIVPSDVSSEGITVREAAKEYFFTHAAGLPHPLGLIVPGEILDVFRVMADAPRYRDLRLCGFVNHISTEEQTQFCAMTVRLPDGGLFAAFRGTDDTIVGWREDFNLSWMDEVPAQRAAVDYLGALPLGERTPLWVGGHSKGGNLAVFGAVMADESVRARIVRVYSNDGPGFSPEFIASERYRTLADRITVLIPQSSFVGLLLDHAEGYEIVSSATLGLLQHNGLSWEVMGASLVRREKLSLSGLRNENVATARICRMTRDERRVFTDLLFDVLESTGARTLTELNDGRLRTVVTMLRTLGSTDRETRELAVDILARLFNLSPLDLPTDLPVPDPIVVETRKGRVTVEFTLFWWRKKE